MYVLFFRNLFMYFADRNAPVTGTARNVSTLIVAHLMLALTFSIAQDVMRNMWHPQNISHTQELLINLYGNCIIKPSIFHRNPWYLSTGWYLLTLSALVSTYKFSKLVSIHFLKNQLREYDNRSRYFLLGDHFINSHNLIS